MLEKAEILSGFSDGNGKVRFFFHTLKSFDRNNVGYISFPFLDVLLKFNLSGVHREAEELFNRYDQDMIGHVHCRELAQRLYKEPPYDKSLSAADKSTVFAMRSVLAGRGCLAGVQYYRQAVRLPSLDG
jgi:hypothetical protein